MTKKKSSKKVLITAGATWVKVDDVRILTNRFSGKTGLYLAQELKRKNHAVTLLINPHCVGKVKNIKAVYYRYFDDFKKKILRCLKNNSYDAIIHMAAISDYKLKKPSKGKIASRKKSLTLSLIPTEKIIKRIRVGAKKSLLIQFKLEAKRKNLIGSAYKSLKENRSDFVVANALEDLKLGYKGFLINKEKDIIPIASRKSLVSILDKAISMSK